jgi:integrase/recombinase XerD
MNLLIVKYILIKIMFSYTKVGFHYIQENRVVISYVNNKKENMHNLTYMDIAESREEADSLSKLSGFEVESILKQRLLKKLSKTLDDSISEWLKIMKPNTAKTYRSVMNTLYYAGILNPLMSMYEFSRENHEELVDKIKQSNNPWAEETRQIKAAVVVSFIAWLTRKYPNCFRCVNICQHGISKTFYKTTEKSKTEAMTKKQWEEWLYELSKINNRDYLIATLTLQGAKRISETLSLQIGQIHFDESTIHFVQSKTNGLKKFIVITYPKHVMDKLREYIGERNNGLLFLTSSGGPVSIIQVSITFSKAGKKANLPFPIHPHVLRASAITYLRQQGYSTDDIMKITGHSTHEMVNFYDKTSAADNATKRISLV